MMDCKLKTFKLHNPNLVELAEVLQNGLQDDFNAAHVSVVQCPNLKEYPFNLAQQGLSGRESVVDVGGECFMMPLPKKEKIYDITAINKELDMTSGLVIGAGAGPAHKLGNISEMIINQSIEDGGKNENYVAMYKEENADSYCLKPVNASELNILANLYICKGEVGQVLKITASAKKGIPSDNNNFIRSLRLALVKHYGEDEQSPLIAIGGVIVMIEGKANIHVMPYFPKPPHGLRSDDDIKSWLKFHEVSAPFTCVGYLINRDNGHSLRLEHFHGYNKNGEGGHFHYTTTADNVKYVAYLNVAQSLYRIDEPQRKNKFEDN